MAPTTPGAACASRAWCPTGSLWCGTPQDLRFGAVSCACEEGSRDTACACHAQRVLAEAFSGSLSLATELIREAHQAQAEQVLQEPSCLLTWHAAAHTHHGLKS